MRILVNHGGQQLGPFSLDELRVALAAGQINLQDLAWWEGAPAWTTVASVPGLNMAGSSGVSSFTGTSSYYQDPASGLATTSLVLGIASFVGFACLTGIPAVICGHIAIGRQKRAGGQASGVAIGGLITGYASFVLLLFIIPMLAAIAVPSFMRARQRAMMTKSLTNGRQIMVGIETYRADHGGQFPTSLDSVVTYIPDKSALIDPLERSNAPKGYWYSKPKDESDHEEIILAGHGTTLEGLRTVGHEDGSVDQEEFTIPPER
jgi:type II secretory pathway pseudopilin PulG